MKNVKRFLCVALVVLCAFSLFSCKAEETENAPETKEKAEKTEDAGTVAYYFEHNGVKVELGAAADSIVTALGAYKDKKEIGDCGGLGAQVKYSYASFDVYVLESKTDGNVIDQVTFRDDIVETPEGVCIGMSVSDAKAKLGEPTSASGDALEYLSGNKLLRIAVADGSVSGIDYMTVTE